jgi:hypothetical protein
MQHDERWSRAIAAAESVLESLRSADQVMLVRAAGRRMDIAHEAVIARDAGTVRAALRALEPGIDRVDFGFAMSTAEQWLRSPRPAVLLHLISDFQQSAAPLRFADLEPPAGSQLVMHDVGAGGVDNIYIESVTLDEGDTRALEVRVRGAAGETPQRDVVLKIDGEEYARRKITLPTIADLRATDLSLLGEGGGSARMQPNSEEDLQEETTDDRAAKLTSVSFGELAFSPGAHRLEVEIEPHDALPQDDRFHAVLEHSDPRALLLARTANADDAAYFAAAIGALTAPRVSVQREPAGSFERNDFDDFAVLVVPDIFALSSAAAAELEKYVSAGGALLTTLGPGTQQAEHALFEGWRIAAPRAQVATIGSIDASHPILRDTPEWHRVRLFRQRSVEVAESDRVLIAHADGAPLLIERTLGAGRMLVLTAPIDRAWSDLAIHPVFVQFISRATRYLIGRDSATASVTVGSSVMTGLTRLTGGQIFDPSGARVLELAQTASADRLIPEALGFYEIRHANGARWLAVNTDRRESDLRRLAPGYRARWQAMRPQAAPATGPAPETVAAAQTQAQSIGPMLMWAAALLLLAEVLIANRYLAVRRMGG